MTTTTPALFDDFASNYESALAEGLAVSGENREYFAAGRCTFLASCLAGAGLSPQPAVIDYGCGTGSTSPLLKEKLHARQVVGTDLSAESLRVAREQHETADIRFVAPEVLRGGALADVVYCNGIFHHIDPEKRAGVLAGIRELLRPGGYFSLWENNPWNPGTRYVMSRIPFDKDAKVLSALEAARLVRAAGFRVVSIHFLFIFPRSLRILRPLEGLVTRFPLGAQYQVLCQR